MVKTLMMAAAAMVALAAAPVSADKYHGNVPEPLIARWCNAWGEGNRLFSTRDARSQICRHWLTSRALPTASR
jgi:hypothetical protein